MLEKEGDLLDKNGELIEKGYHTKLIKNYSRDMIKANKLRIKEWDYYYIGNDKYGFAFTIDDNSYMDLCSISILDFENKSYLENSRLHLFSLGRRNLPSSSIEGITHYKDKKVDLTFTSIEDKTRTIKGTFKKFDKDNDLIIDITLKRSNDNSMVIVTPFNKKKHFYYNQKINALFAYGYIKLGSKEYILDDSYMGVLDWGRGVWTYKNTWYWSSFQSKIDNDIVSFNLGYGFGDTSAASENMLFINNEVIKLNEVKFDILKDKKGKDDFLKEFKIYSDDNIINLTFKPILNRHADTNLLFLRSNQNQIFGYFDGEIKVNDKTFKINNKVGFAEKVFNKW